MFVLSLSYLLILQHVAGISTSPLSASRQFALVKTRGPDHDDEGLFEPILVSLWHPLPGSRRQGSRVPSKPFELVDTAA